MKLGRLKRSLVVVLGLATALVWSAPSLGDTQRIKASGTSWSPDFRHIVKGDRIVWKNPTGARHTVTAYGGGWSKDTSLSSGDRTKKRFRRAGTYEFRCTIHSSLSGDQCEGMCGEVHVTRR